MTKPAKVTERAWQTTIVETLELFGYAVSHTFPLRTKDGWRTPTISPGWPDLIAVRAPRLLAIECKTDVAPKAIPLAQRAWLSAFASVPCARAWVLRPRDDWPTIVEWVRHPKDAPRIYGFDPVDDPVVTLGSVHGRLAR